MSKKILNNPIDKAQSKHLRNNPTPEEDTLWQELRVKRLGAKFRRNYSIGDYIVNFYSPSIKLAIEIDDCTHYNEKGEADKKTKDDYIRSQGIDVIRVPEVAIANSLLEVCQLLENEVASRKKILELD